MPSHRLSVFAVDPGETTGWAVVSVPPESLLDRSINLLEDMEFDCGQLTGSEDAQAERLCDLAITFDGPVIIEDFTLRQFRMDRSLLSPVRVTAKLEYDIYLVNKDVGKESQIRIKKQQPSLAKSTATDARLKEWGLWEVGAPHARDAIRHAVTFLRRAKADRKIRQWAWPDLK